MSRKKETAVGNFPRRCLSNHFCLLLVAVLIAVLVLILILAVLLVLVLIVVPILIEIHFNTSFTKLLLTRKGLFIHE